MKERPETTTPAEEKESANWWVFVLWPVVVLLLYVLSAGPVVMLLEQKRISLNNPLLAVYEPLDWVDRNTMLGRPFRMYLHLWAPNRFDAKGNNK
jgi:hypothetical protein